MTTQPPPVIVVDGLDAEALDEVVDRLTARGYTVVEGFDRLPLAGGRTVCRGTVRTAEDAAKAVLAVVWGAGLVVAVLAPPEVRTRLLDDLRRLGPVDHDVPAPQPAPAIDETGSALLNLLSEGHTLGEAARLLFLSRRTADRRLAEARRALGVDTTAEAVVAWRRSASSPGRSGPTRT